MTPVQKAEAQMASAYEEYRNVQGNEPLEVALREYRLAEYNACNVRLKICKLYEERSKSYEKVFRCRDKYLELVEDSKE